MGFSYKLALVKGIRHLPLWRLTPVLLQVLTLDMTWREFSMESEALYTLGNLAEQVFR